MQGQNIALTAHAAGVAVAVNATEARKRESGMPPPLLPPGFLGLQAYLLQLGGRVAGTASAVPPGSTSCLCSSPPTFGLPRWLRGKESTCQCRGHKRHTLDPWVGKIPWSRKWQPTPVFLPRESRRQGSLANYSPWGHKDLGTTEHAHTPPTFKCTGVWNSPASWCIGQMWLC